MKSFEIERDKNQDTSPHIQEIQLKDREDYDVEEGGPRDRKFLSMIPEVTIMEKLTGLVATVSVVCSMIAVIVEGGILLQTAGILSCLLGPYSYWQLTQITDIKALKETYEAFVVEVNRLHEENERLSENVENLSKAVDRLEEVEETLAVVTKTQGQSVETFQTQVENNKEILVSMEKNLKAVVLQNLLSVVIKSDSNHDSHFDSSEVNNLMRRLHNINNVDFNETKLRNVFKENNGSVDSIMEVITNLLTAKRGNAIFAFH